MKRSLSLETGEKRRWEPAMGQDKDARTGHVARCPICVFAQGLLIMMARMGMRD